MQGYAPVAEVVRSGFVEGLHFGALVGMNADGSVAFSVGDVARPFHPRSANKLMQATRMRDLGLPLTDQLLALSAASHWGEPRHIEGVRSILGSVGLDESSLATPPALPEDQDARVAVLRAGGAPAPIFHGCSGKHAAMLATCVLRDWPTSGYLAPTHPLHVELREAIEAASGEPVVHQAVDGCGAPAWTLSLTALATIYGKAVTAEVGSPVRAVADAMRAHPEFVCGEQSEVTGLMRTVPGLLAKDGAESVYVAAFADGRAVALKISDGGFRAGQAVLVRALSALGAADEPGVDVDALDGWGTVPILGHGERVGEIRALVP